MIEYQQTVLDNGLTVLANRDRESKMAAFNIIYRVGSRNEDPDHTGFAHLFEHLMFRGTRRVPDFDRPVQLASGENNAFTSNDYTDFYITLPKENIETAFWLESDRMTGLKLTERVIGIEKQVVVEEFNQRYLNQPYGDQWLLLRPVVYTRHPYRWPTIGSTPDHILSAPTNLIKAFYKRYYRPSNAIVSVSADMECDEVFDMARKWFGGIESAERPLDTIATEPEQTAPRRLEVERDVKAEQITIAFVMATRLSEEYYVADMMSDILAGGTSSRMYNSLVKQQQLFSSVNAYITGDLDAGMFVLTGRPLPAVDTARAEQALLDETLRLVSEPPTDYELDKVKNKFEANTLFGELNVMNKAMNLGYYNMLGDMSLLNGEVDIFRSIDADRIARYTQRLVTANHSSTLVIHPKR